ncbi:MAG: hypothetical protein ACI4S3_08330 [Candidatus Gastranaerophilaceae bacterium]
MDMLSDNYTNSNQFHMHSIKFKALPNQYSKVDEYLIRGKHPSVRDLFCLKKEGVNQIYDFRHISTYGFKFIEKYLCKIMGIKYIRIPYSNLYGNYPDKGTFEKISAQVKQNGINGGKTLFHCNSGSHRTSHFSAFYSLTNGDSLDVAKKRLNGLYQFRVSKVIKEQILDKNYFSRKKINYRGLNFIKRIWVNRNNKIYDSLNKAQVKFISMIIE